VIRFVMRGRASVATLAPDDLVAAREGDVLELTRGQETELPQALKWQVARADEDYDAALVEARRITVDTTRIASESFPMAVPPEEAERRCRRALMEAWVGRETAAFRLPPSRLALDPADAIRLAHDGRLVDLRLVSIADAEARGIEAVRQDRATYDLPPGDPRAASLTRGRGVRRAGCGADGPAAADRGPARASAAGRRARGSLAGRDGGVPQPLDRWLRAADHVRQPRPDRHAGLDFSIAGPTSRFDLGNALVVDLLTGTLESVTDLTLFGGANALAIESAPGVWEIVQAGAAELLAPGRYRLTRLLRGQRGTEGAMGNPAPAGARVVVLDDRARVAADRRGRSRHPVELAHRPGEPPGQRRDLCGAGLHARGRRAAAVLVAHVEQPWRRPRTPGDLTIRWTRRSRALAADSWGGLEVPLAEELEAYEVEILDGATVKRVLSTTTTSAVYTAAQQTADWGAPLGPGDTLDIRIFQLSALVGRGAPKTVTLTSEGHPMSDATTHLLLPYILAAQAQKHVTHNEALRILDGLVQLSVLDRDLTAPPGSPADGDRYIVGSGATGDWAGWDLNVALWTDGAWLRLPPRTGWRAWVEDEGLLLVYDGAGWIGTTPARCRTSRCSGLGTTADASNPFSAKLNAALWTAKTVAEGGTGDLFYTMNKEAAGDDLGLTLQTGFVTKALVGLFGSDSFRLAVSADGSTFFDGLSVDNATGIVDQPRLPRFKAYTNYDNYVGVGTWTKIGLNNTDYNDQGAFDAANNHFVAPVDGTYLFGATLLYKINASATARMRGRLVLNGTTEIRGSLGEISATHVSLATAIWLQTMVPLTAGDTVELQGYFRVADGYFAADHTSFWGCKVG
jgi:hypothetical protein